MSILFSIVKFGLPLLGIVWAWRLYRRGFAAWAVATLAGSVGLVLGSVVAVLVMNLGRGIMPNPMHRLTVALVIGTIVFAAYLLVVRVWRRRLVSRFASFPPALPHAIDRALCSMATVVIALAVWLAVDFVARVEAIDAMDPLDVDTHVTTTPDPATPTPALPDPSPTELADMQRRLFAGLRRGVDASRQFVYESTGLDELLVQLQAFRQLLHLRDDEREWLLSHHPQIVALIDDPVMQRVIQNNRIADLIDEVDRGSITALYALGREPDIQSLLDDPKLYALVRSLDLLAMVQQVETYRAERQRK